MHHGLRSCLVAAAVAVSASGALAVTQEQLEQAQRERDLAKALQEKAEAEAAAAKARLGSLDTSALPKGSGEASGLSIEGRVMAYRAAGRIADDILAAVANLPQRPVVLYSQAELNAVMRYRALVRQTQLLQQAVTHVTVDPAHPQLPQLSSESGPCAKPIRGATIVPSGVKLGPLDQVGVALQLLSLFKSDRKLTGADVSLDDLGLAALVMERLVHAGVRVAYPPSYLPMLFSASADPFAQSPLLQSVQAVFENQTALDQLRRLVTRKRDELSHREEGASPDCKALMEADLGTLATLEANATAVGTAIGQLQATLLKVDESSGAAGLQSVFVAESLARTFAGAYVLQLKALSAGGATQARTNLFGTRFSFSGGAIVSYLILDGESGQVLDAGTRTRYAGFLDEGQLPESE